MIKRLIGALVLAASPAVAADFSEGSQAKNWPLKGREKAKFSAKVTDAVCALTGDCPADCGGGKRQMVLIREADNKMLLVSKNLQFQFQGPTWDLAPHCNKVIEVDGLMVGDDPTLKSKMYQIQLINTGDGEWAKANGFNKPWLERNPDSGGKGPWFRRDPHIDARIQKTGFLGLGVEAEKEFIAEELDE